MDRLACVDLSAFPLQLLLRREPEWSKYPAVVVEEDRPQGVILWANEAARAARILPGHRYAHALSLARELRAGVVPPAEIARGVDAVVEALRAFSPDVEPAADEPGVFWLDAAGLQRLYRSPAAWGRAVRARLRRDGFRSSMVVGCTRFGSYALARAQRDGLAVLRDAADERDAARRVPLERLDLDPALRDTLCKLGVTTVGAFLRLPAGGLLERFGAQAFRLHQLAAGERWDPLQPRAARAPLVREVLFDEPEEDVTRLVFAIKRALDALLDALAAQKAALAALFLDMALYRCEDEPRRLEAIRPAAPTLDARALLRLVHLRLESSPLPAGVVELRVAAEDVPATREQLQLFAHKPRRDLRAANEAFARLRAELGNDAVVRATLRDGHLPEARFVWEPMECAAFPTPRPVTVRPLVRRVFDRPVLLPPQNPNVRDDGWLLRGLEHGPVTEFLGPYIVSGGWWASEVHREYHFAHTRRGECLWVYFDRRRRRWFLHGQVE